MRKKRGWMSVAGYWETTHIRGRDDKYNRKREKRVFGCHIRNDEARRRQKQKRANAAKCPISHLRPRCYFINCKKNGAGKCQL